MSITKRIAASLARLRSLFSQKESNMSDQTVIDPTLTQAASPAEDFAIEMMPPASAEVATPIAAEAAPEVSQASQDISEGVKDFAVAFSFVEQGVIKLGDAAKGELIELARKYL
jgi:hypothetical protein